MRFQVPGDPHPWPGDAQAAIHACALIIVDMQQDYCSAGYYMDRAGYDTQRLRQPVARVRMVLAAARCAGMPTVFTRHARAAHDRSDPAPAAHGEPGWQIVEELSPLEGEAVIEKTTCSAFMSGELDRLLRDWGVRHLAFCGNTIDVCVHSTLRTAVDLGYDCLLIGDACGAVSEGLHAWAIASVKVEGGVFGTVASAEAFAGALSAWS